jgi:hypothetical protein
MRTQATERCSSRKASSIISVPFYEDVLGANTLPQTSDTSKGRVCLPGVLRCDEFLHPNGQARDCYNKKKVLTALPRKSRVLAFLSLFSDGR